MEDDEMTLRDRFACLPVRDYNVTMEAAAELLGMEVPSDTDLEGAIKLSAALEAKIRYTRADAMLRERAAGDRSGET